MDVSQHLQQQQDVIQQFREKIKDTSLAKAEDIELLKWLIARNYDLGRSEAMLRNSLEWRRQHKIDDLADPSTFPEVLVKYFPVGVSGADKFGCPVWIVAYGRADLKGVLSSVKRKDYINFVASFVEKSKRLMYENQTRLKIKKTTMMQQTVIFDMYDFSMKHITHKPSMDTALQLVQMYEANYPELLRRVYVINAPRVFTIAWNLLKPFLHERTKNKVSIYGSDSAAWKAAILQDVDADQLPVFYGGNMTDPDGNPQCLTKICMGGEVPKTYYMNNNNKPKVDGKTLSVANGSKQQLEYEIKSAGSALRWAFSTDEGDIAFAVYRKKGDELIDLVPRERVDSHVCVEEGEVICDDAGLYIVEFDNSFSYMRSKKVTYAISVGAAHVPEFTEF